MKDKVINYWESLNQREKIILASGILFTVVVILYYLISFMVFLIIDKTQLIQKKQEDLHWLEQVVKSDAFKMVKLPVEKKLTFLTQELQDEAWKNYPYQLQESEKGEVQLSFAKAPYGLFMLWLKNMNTKRAVVIKKLVVEKTDTKGIVKINLLLQ